MSEPACDDPLRALLPWQANGSLAASEGAALQSHLEHCAYCRRELARCSALARAWRAVLEDSGWTPSAAHWQRVLANLEHAQAPRVALLERLAHRLGATRLARRLGTAPLRWSFAAQAAALALGVALVAQLGRTPNFVTLSSPESALPSQRVALRIAFADGVAEHDRLALLSELHAVLVRGPNSLGVYTIELTNDPAPAEVASLLDALRAEARVRLAERAGPGR